MRLRTAFAALGVLLCMSATSRATNALYDSWAKHGAGTSVTQKVSSTAGEMKSEMETVYTLKEVTKEKVTIEMKASMTANGTKMDLPAQSMDIPSDGDSTTTPPANSSTPGVDVKTTEETVTVAGKEYKATVTETTVTAEGSKSHSKIWTSPDMPNMTIKMESSTEGQMATSTKSEVSAVDLK